MTQPKISQQVRIWAFPPETKVIPESQFVDLEVVDISGFISGKPESTPEALETVKRTLKGFQDTGFIVLTGHGLTQEAVCRQVDLAYVFLSVSDEAKHRYHAKIQEEGSWAGYKPQGFHKRTNGARDTNEFHDFYPQTVAEDFQPSELWPYLDEIRAFYKHNHFVLLRTVLSILSQGLGLPPDTFWNLHHRESGVASEIQTKDMFRQAMYHPPTEEDREKAERIWLPSHTDRGSLTFLYSQPVAGLQAFVNGQWKYVRYYPNGILVNLGDAMEFTTGHLLSAAIHRVYEPPSDQRHLRRLALFYFATMLPETLLKPLDVLESGAQLPAHGVFDEFDGKIPTAGEWQIRRAMATGEPADRNFFQKRFPQVDDAGIVDPKFKLSSYV